MAATDSPSEASPDRWIEIAVRASEADVELVADVLRELAPDGVAIVPAIRGSAWITGITQVLVDPTDPFPEGYLLSDTWPGPDVQA